MHHLLLKFWYARYAGGFNPRDTDHIRHVVGEAVEEVKLARYGIRAREKRRKKAEADEVAAAAKDDLENLDPPDPKDVSATTISAAFL